MTTPIVLAWSGGKDSAMALEALRADPRWEVRALVTAVTRGFNRVSIHGVRREILHAQADAVALPLVEAWLDAKSSNEAYEEAWDEALAEARDEIGFVEHVAYGDLFLEDVRAYRDALMSRLGYAPVYPLWGRPTPALARAFASSGWRAILTCVDTTQLAGEFAGRAFDNALLDELPPGVDPCGERGEFHTCVVAGPAFTSPIAVEPGERVLRDERFQYCDLILR
jgi:uncharacterized protein (TIGR00290 family)